MHGLAQRPVLSRTIPRLLLAAGLVVLALFPGMAAAGNAGFVKVQDAQFTLDGQRFDFVGTVAFALLAGKIYGMESFTHDVIDQRSAFSGSAASPVSVRDNPSPPSRMVRL